MKRLVPLLPLILVAVGCTQGGAPAADPAEVTARSAEWDAALNAKDIDGIVALYTDDARMMAPNMPMSTGSDGVRAAFSGMIEAGLSVKLTSIDTVVAGDLAYNVGTYVLTAGDEQADVGKYLEIWERGADGEWHMSNDIYNSDLPVAAPEPSMPMEMTHVVITHEVEDGEAWQSAWRGEDSRHALFKANGAAHVHTFGDPNNPNMTGLVVAVTDMDALTAMLESEEGVAAATADGVKLDTLVMHLQTE